MDVTTLTDETLEELRIAILNEQDRRHILATAQDRIDELTALKVAAEAEPSKPDRTDIDIAVIEAAPVKGKR